MTRDYTRRAKVAAGPNDRILYTHYITVPHNLQMKNHDNKKDARAEMR